MARFLGAFPHLAALHPCPGVTLFEIGCIIAYDVLVSYFVQLGIQDCSIHTALYMPF